METMVIPRHNLKGIATDRINIKLVEVSRTEEAFRYLFG